MDPVQGNLKVCKVLNIGLQRLLDDKRARSLCFFAMPSSCSASSLGSLTDIAVFMTLLLSFLYYTVHTSRIPVNSHQPAINGLNNKPTISHTIFHDRHRATWAGNRTCMQRPSRKTPRPFWVGSNGKIWTGHHKKLIFLTNTLN